MRYSFSLWDKGVVSFELPIERGGVNTRKYYPKAILTRNNNSILAQTLIAECSSSDPNEVSKDLQEIRDYINKYKIKVEGFEPFLSVVNNSVQKHIQKFGRLYFNDLSSYIDLVAYVMAIGGYSELVIQNCYLKCIYEIVRKYGSIVQDGAFGIIVPFSETPKYRNVIALINERHLKL